MSAYYCEDPVTNSDNTGIGIPGRLLDVSLEPAWTNRDHLKPESTLNDLELYMNPNGHVQYNNNISNDETQVSSLSSQENSYLDVPEKAEEHTDKSYPRDTTKELFNPSFTHRKMQDKPRYTADEDWVIAQCHQTKVPWTNIPGILAISDPDTQKPRKKGGLQVHFSQAISKRYSFYSDLSGELRKPVERLCRQHREKLIPRICEEYIRLAEKEIPREWLESAVIELVEIELRRKRDLLLNAMRVSGRGKNGLKRKPKDS